MEENKKAEIEKEAMEILNRFGKMIEGVKFKGKEFKKAAGGYREEGKGEKCDADFRVRMLENAPEKDEDCIIAEKKTW